MTQSGSGFTPLAATNGQPPRLAMQRLWLSGQVLPAGARLSVEHTFQSDEDKPLEVIYSFPLPRDAALRRFRIRGEGWETESDLRPTEEACKAYEAGIREGALSALAQQHGDGVVNLAVGNLRPKEMVTVHLEIVAGVELRDDGFRFRFPFTLAPAYHRQAKAILVGEGEGEMRLPREVFGDVVLPRFRKDATGLHRVGFDLAVVRGPAAATIGSPSHAIRVTIPMTMGEEGGMRVCLGAEGDVPDRDLVLDVNRRDQGAAVLAGRGEDGKGHFAAIVPSTAFGVNPETARRVVILLDRSGSMGGEPIRQARRAIEACLGALSQDDLFGLVAFDDQTEVFRPALCAATQENRVEARRFLSGVDARGGTELARGILEAASLLSGGGGDVLVLTDGQVSATEEILATARRAGARLHSLGIGSASQDRFLTLLARETGGVGRFVTPGERVDLAAVELFASVGRPVATGLVADGSVAPAPPAAVFSGTPVLLFGEIAEEGPIQLRWDGGGHLTVPVRFGSEDLGDTLRLLQGSRLITDWESRYAAGGESTDERQRKRVAGMLAELGRTYGLANREMSLVAVVKRAGDRPGELPETRVVPVGMPRDTAFQAYFGNPPGGGTAAMYAMPAPCAARPSFCLSAPALLRDMGGALSTLKRRVSAGRSAAAPAQPVAETAEDRLMSLAAQMEPDGGMPGKNAGARVAATIAALKEFVSQGHTPSHGAFRSHAGRLAAYLEKCKLTERQREEVEQLLGRSLTM